MRLCAAVIVASLFAVTPAYADAAHQIVPGEGIGPIELGGTVQSAIALLGPPHSTTNTTKDDGPAVLYRWFDTDSGSGFAITTLPDGRITQVSIRNSPAYETAEHLRTGGPNGSQGSSAFDIRRRLGEPAAIKHSPARGFEYNSGIRFWFDGSQHVVQIDVF